MAEEISSLIIKVDTTDVTSANTALMSLAKAANATGMSSTAMGGVFAKAAKEISSRADDMQKAFRASIKPLDEEREKLQETIKKLNERGDAADELNAAEKRLADITTQSTSLQDQYSTSMGNLVKTFEDGKRVMEQFEAPQDKYARKLAEINEMHQKGAIDDRTFALAMADARKEIDASVMSLAKYASIGSAALAGVAVAAVKMGIDYESAFAGVRKTVDATEGQFAALSDGIRNMAKEMPQSAAEIAGITEAAGQLGIKTDSLLSFTKTMAMLGDTTNLSSTDAANSLARLANITGMPQSEFDKLGSTIVALGNNFATTEAEIVDMGMRLAGAGAQVGMTEAQIMGFATALSSVGIASEAGGSAFSKVMINMQLAVETGSAELKNFADVAKMTTGEFATAFKDDAAGAIQSFLEGLNDTSHMGKSAIAVIDEMGISETRLRDALLRGAGAADMFGEAIKVGSGAWKENTALQNEAQQRYNTTAAALGILKNNLVDAALSLSDTLLPAFRVAVDVSQTMANTLSVVAKWFNGTGAATKVMVLGVGGIAAAVPPAVMGIIALEKAKRALNTQMAIFSSTSAPKMITGLKGIVGALGPIAGVAMAAQLAIEALASAYEGSVNKKIAKTDTEAAKSRAAIEEASVQRLIKLREEYAKNAGQAGFNADELERLSRGHVKMAARLENTKREIAGLAPLSQQEIDDMGKKMYGLESLAEKRNKSNKVLLEETTATEASKEATERYKKIMEEGRGVYESVMTPMEKYGAELEKLDTLKKSGAISQETYNRAILEAGKPLDDMREKLLSSLDTEEQAIARSYKARTDEIKTALSQQVIVTEEYDALMASATTEQQKSIDELNKKRYEERDSIMKLAQPALDERATIIKSYEDKMKAATAWIEKREAEAAAIKANKDTELQGIEMLKAAQSDYSAVMTGLIDRQTEALDKLNAKREAERDKLLELAMSEQELLVTKYEKQRAVILENELLTEQQRKQIILSQREELEFRIDELNQKQIANAQAAAAAVGRAYSDAFNSVGAVTNGLAQLTAAVYGKQLQVSAEAYEKMDAGAKEAYDRQFAMIKAFNTATALMNVSAAIASAATTQPFIPAGLAAMGTAASATAGLVTAITSQKFSGAYDTGGTLRPGTWGIAGEYGPEIVKGPATVISRAETADLLSGEGQSEPANTEQAAPQQVVINLNDQSGGNVESLMRYLHTGDLNDFTREFFQRGRAMGVI